MNTRKPAVIALIGAILVGLLAGGASAVVVLDDSLQGSTSGTRSGGQFVTGGWKVTAQYDCIYWHLPYTVSKGAAEYYVKGINPREDRTGMEDKSEIFHMYDYTVGSADTVYDGGYRDNPYKHFLRHNGVLSDYNGTTDAMEVVWKINANEIETDTPVLSWDPNTNYLFREEWGPDGQGNSVLKIYRNGQLILNNGVAGTYAPAGHSVRVAASPRRASDAGAPVDAIFSYLKVWDLTNEVPGTPTLSLPTTGTTLKYRTVFVQWSGDVHTKYQVRVCSVDNADQGIVYDSGEVTSSLDYAWTGTLPDQATYYVFVKLGNENGWSSWSSTGRWFTVNTNYTPTEANLVKVWGNTLVDNNGPFLGLGFTYMQALRRCKYDRTRFRSDLAFMSSKGFKYMRALSMVGYYTYWSGLEIAPIGFYNQDNQWVPAWSDYWQQFRDMIDIAYDDYGIRTELTIFADAQLMPNESDRYTHMDNVLSNIAGREHKVVLLEVANEYWQNGFPDPDGVSTVRAFGQYLADRTSIPVALSSPSDTSDSGIANMYSGSAADIATVHFSREIGTSEGGWLPVRDCWRITDIGSVPPGSSNEPIGPGSSVAEETDPVKLVSAAAFAFAAKLPHYVYHTDAGVKGLTTFESRAGVNDFQYLDDVLPPDLPGWVRNDGKQSSAPFTAYCMGQANKYWTDVTGATNGCHRNIGGVKGNEFVAYCQGILGGGVTLEARQLCSFKVYNPMTGAIVLDTSKNQGEQFTLSQGPGAYVIKGTTGQVSYGDAVFIDLGSPDVADGMTHPQPGDGNTIADSQGGVSCKRNVNSSEDLYFYFGVADAFAYQGSTQEFWVTIDYYDIGSGSLSLQYDASGGAYSAGGSVALTNSITWKSHTFHVTDAYFGNRQNDGADFRIAAPVGLTFYLDVVEVSKTEPVIPVNDADYVSDTIPTTMTASQQYSVSVTMQNTGNTTWTQAGDYKLGAVDDTDPFAGNRVNLGPSDSIAPTQSKTFSFTMTAPSAPGAYTTDWRMVQDGVEWFGATLTKQVQVNATYVPGTVNVKTAGAIVVDGATGDWALGDFTTNSLAGQSQTGDIALTGFSGGACYYAGRCTDYVLPSSATDHTGKVYSRHDGTYQYFLVRCDDSDMRYSNPTSANWANDCVEFYIDPSHDHGSSAMSDSSSDVQLVIDANNQKNVYMCTSGYTSQVLAGVESAVVRDASGWWLEAKIAKSALDPDMPASGTFGVDFNFRDNDNNNDVALSTIYTWADNTIASGFPSKIPAKWGNGSLAALPSQSAYTGGPWSVPGTVQTENYDFGGEGVAYHDTNGSNDGGQYRADGVDIEATGDTGGGYNVGWINTGEWLEYAVNVATAGQYDIKVRVASPDTGGALHIEMNGQNVSGTMSVPNTGGWQTFTTVTAANKTLSAGQQVMRVYVENGGWNFNYVELTKSVVTISNSTFDSDANGWTIVTWKSGPYDPGQMFWSSSAGNPGGGMRCYGSGATDNTDRCNREGGEIKKTISTVGYGNLQLSYDLRVNSLGLSRTGAGIGTCAVDHNLIDEQLTVFYSTNGGANWTEAEWMKRSILLGYTTYGTRTIDLSGASGVNNNASFMLRFRWQVNSTADTAELDNIKLTGIAQ